MARDILAETVMRSLCLSMYRGCHLQTVSVQPKAITVCFLFDDLASLVVIIAGRVIILPCSPMVAIAIVMVTSTAPAFRFELLNTIGPLKRNTPVETGAISLFLRQLCQWSDCCPFSHG